jgi:putative PIN family toxin of toxin-antitoxin system
MGANDGMTVSPIPRIVLDTNVVLSAILFPHGRLAWLRLHWQQGGCTPLVSAATVHELMRVLAYSKFRLPANAQAELLGLYIPHCKTFTQISACSVCCRDPKDQALLDLAHCGKAEILVSGDEDLLALAGQTEFVIETPEAYRRRHLGRL